MLRHIAVLVSAIVATFTLIACSGANNEPSRDPATSSTAATPATDPTTDTTSRAPETAHNDADVLFAQRMMPFNAQAISMADKVQLAGSNAEVRALAATIRAEQAPQVDLMYSLLITWGKPPAGHEGTAGLEGVPGMVTDDQIAPLYEATGVELDRLYLTLMAQHHRAAVELATGEQSAGLNSQALDLATWIRSTRTVQLGTIEALARRLP